MPVILGGNTGIYLASLAPAFDPDAQAFITAAAITDPTQQAAINTLVVDLKGYNVWNKMKALYPIVGGTAAQHKWNLKNPLDTDAAFRLTFSGGWTHSSTGALPNGTNAYADTKLIPNTNLINNNSHLSYYSRTNADTGFDIGCQDDIPPGNKTFYLSCRYSGNFYTSIQAFDVNRVVVSNTDSRGLFVASRNSITSLKSYKNGTLQGTNTVTSNGTLSQIFVPIGVLNYRDSVGGISFLNYTQKQCAFASIGDGLTDTEAANFYTAVQTFQTTLGRQV